MSRTHSNKLGVRYRYYVSHALLQNRKQEAGSVARMPAPDVEQLGLDGVGTHLRSLELPIEGVDRDLIERHVDRVIIGAQAVEVRLMPSDAKEPPELHRDELDASGPTSTPLVLPWKAPAFVAVKDIVHTPTAVPPMAPEARDALLSAIAKARGWIEELQLGCVATLAEIAECEGFGERHVRVLAPLAFGVHPCGETQKSGIGCDGTSRGLRHSGLRRPVVVTN